MSRGAPKNSAPRQPHATTATRARSATVRKADSLACDEPEVDHGAHATPLAAISDPRQDDGALSWHSSGPHLAFFGPDMGIATAQTTSIRFTQKRNHPPDQPARRALREVHVWTCVVFDARSGSTTPLPEPPELQTITSADAERQPPTMPHMHSPIAIGRPAKPTRTIQNEGLCATAKRKLRPS
jgi:hypothetical protein